MATSAAGEELRTGVGPSEWKVSTCVGGVPPIRQRGTKNLAHRRRGVVHWHSKSTRWDIADLNLQRAGGECRDGLGRDGKHFGRTHGPPEIVEDNVDLAAPSCIRAAWGR
jgi:hypothetical protein